MDDEVVDLDDQRVLHLGQELPLGDRRLVGVGVAGVEQALEHDEAVGHVLVAGEVDPAEAAVGEAAGDLVLPADEVAGLQLGRERELACRTSGRSPRCGPGLPSRLRPTGELHFGAEALVLGDLGDLHHRVERAGDRRWTARR